MQGSFALELWVRLNHTQQSQKYLLGKGNRCAVIYGYAGNTVEFFAAPGTFGGSDPQPYSAIPLEDTEWHHIVYSYDHEAGLFFRYKHGELVPPSPQSVDFSVGSSGDDLFFGAAGAQGLNNVDAVLDEVALYDRSLQPSEVRAHYQARNCARSVCSGARLCMAHLAPVGADTFVHSLFPTQSYGTATTLLVGTEPATSKGATEPHKQRGLFAFDLAGQLPSGALLRGAWLHAYRTGV